MEFFNVSGLIRDPHSYWPDTKSYNIISCIFFFIGVTQMNNAPIYFKTENKNILIEETSFQSCMKESEAGAVYCQNDGGYLHMKKIHLVSCRAHNKNAFLYYENQKVMENSNTPKLILDTVSSVSLSGKYIFTIHTNDDSGNIVLPPIKSLNISNPRLIQKLFIFQLVGSNDQISFSYFNIDNDVYQYLPDLTFLDTLYTQNQIRISYCNVIGVSVFLPENDTTIVHFDNSVFIGDKIFNEVIGNTHFYFGVNCYINNEPVLIDKRNISIVEDISKLKLNILENYIPDIKNSTRLTITDHHDRINLDELITQGAYLKNCLFRDFYTQESGGAISITMPSFGLEMESISFYSCFCMSHFFNVYGGAMYYEGTNITLNARKICGHNCSCLNYGHFFHVSDYLMNTLYLNDTTVSLCSENDHYSGTTNYLQYSIYMKSFNSSRSYGRHATVVSFPQFHTFKLSIAYNTTSSFMSIISTFNGNISQSNFVNNYIVRVSEYAALICFLQNLSICNSSFINNNALRIVYNEDQLTTENCYLYGNIFDIPIKTDLWSLSETYFLQSMPQADYCLILSNHSKSLDWVQILTIVLSVLVFIAAISVSIFCYIQKRARKMTEQIELEKSIIDDFG